MVDDIRKPDGLGREEAIIDFAGRLDRYKPEEVSVSIGNNRQRISGLAPDLALTITATTTADNKETTSVLLTTVGLFLETRLDPRISLSNQRKLDGSFQKALRAGITSGRITP